MNIELERVKANLITITEKLLQHWASLVAVIYAYASLLNIAHTNTLFELFRVPIWEYYESHDVLIGAFMRASSVTWALILVLVGVISLAISSTPNSPKGATTVLALASTAIIAVTPFVAISASANEEAFEVMYLTDDVLTVTTKDNVSFANMKLIGSAGKFHVYYKQDTQTVYALNEGEIRAIKQSQPVVITDMRLSEFAEQRTLFIDKSKLVNKNHRPEVHIRD